MDAVSDLTFYLLLSNSLSFHTVYITDYDEEAIKGPVIVACECSDETKTRLKVLIFTKKVTQQPFPPNFSSPSQG